MGSFSDGHAWAADRDWRESRRNCSEKFLEVFIRYQPRVWVMESVTQLTTKGREFVNRVMTTGRDLGYAGWLVFHDPKFMGIAQTRRRVLMVLSRVDIRWNPPSGVMTSMRDVIKKLPTPRKFIPIPQPDSYWWKVAKDGEDFIRAWERSGARPVLKPKHKTAHRISLDTPMGTIHRDGHFGHHTECRFLTGEELAVINGYPSDYKWSQSDARTRTEVAKGVSPVVGDWLGRCLKQSLVTNKPASTGVLTTINFMAKSQRRSDAVMLNEVKVGEM
jgi:site-specific DNA-cytosine methylase